MTNRTILSTLPAERQEAILTLLARGTRVVAADLARAFDASEDTIRRDLRDLAAAGLCRRVYGGALPVSPASGSLETRENEARERKGALGRAAARLARAGSTLFIDAGTTNLAIARALPVDLGLTVVTNAPSLAAAIAGTAGLELVLIGGRVDPRSGAALGARAFRDASEIRVDLAFLGACAVDAEAGVAAFGAEEAEFKRLVASRAAAVVAAVTTDKLATAAPFFVVPAAALSRLVVERDAPEAALTPFVAAGVKVTRADAAAERAA